MHVGSVYLFNVALIWVTSLNWILALSNRFFAIICMRHCIHVQFSASTASTAVCVCVWFWVCLFMSFPPYWSPRTEYTYSIWKSSALFLLVGIFCNLFLVVSVYIKWTNIRYSRNLSIRSQYVGLAIATQTIPKYRVFTYRVSTTETSIRDSFNVIVASISHKC